MMLLILLVENRSKLVTREEIETFLWPESGLVDVVQGINAAVNRIRAVLNDDASKPRFIETVIGEGYRFIARVEEMVEESAPIRPPIESESEQEALSALSTATEVEPAPGELQVSRPPSRPLVRRSFVWLLVGGIGLLVAGSLAALRWKTHANPMPEPVFRQITTLVPENRATAAALSPDGKLTVFANADGVFLRRENGLTTELRSPPDFIVDRLAWVPDGSEIVVSGFSAVTNIPGIWLSSLTGTTLLELRRAGRQALPSPDGTRIAFVSRDWSEIWVMGTSGEMPHSIVNGSVGDTFPIVLWSADGRRLIFQRRQRAEQVQDVTSYEVVVVDTKQIVSRQKDPGMSSASLLTDGRLFFLRWDNGEFVSSRELWEVGTNLATSAWMGEPRKIAASPGDSITLLDLSVTADGTRAMVLKRSEQNSIFVGDLDQNTPRIFNTRRLTLDERTNYPHAWTADSRAVIFESNRNGNYDLFKQDIDRRTPETIVATPFDEVLPQLAPDGHTVLYATRRHENQRPYFYNSRPFQLMRVSSSGGIPQEVELGEPLDEFVCALGPGTRCVLRSTRPGKDRTYYELDAVKGKGRELAQIRWSYEILGDWAISPDGTQIAIPNHDGSDAQIRVVTFGARPDDSREREVILPGVSNLRGLIWTADGRGWFVSVDTTVGSQMLYARLDGQFKALGDIQGWVVPSPDGHKVAFLNAILATNAWMIDMR